MDIGHRHLGRGDEEEFRVRQPEEVFLEFGKLAGGGHGVAVDHERGQHLHVPMLLRMQVEHEAGQGALQTRAGAPIEREAGTGDLGCPLEIKDAQPLADLPVGLGRKSERLRLAPAPDHHVVVFRDSQRRARGRAGWERS